MAPKWMMGAAVGQQWANVCTWAMTSCLNFLSSSAAMTKSMSSAWDSISLTWASVMGRPNACRQNIRAIKKCIKNRLHFHTFNISIVIQAPSCNMQKLVSSLCFFTFEVWLYVVDRTSIMKVTKPIRTFTGLENYLFILFCVAGLQSEQLHSQ